MKIKNIRKKIITFICLTVFFALLALFLFSGDNLDLLRSLFTEKHTNEELQEKLRQFGIKGYVTIAILSMMQIVLPFLPAEPVQVVAGVAFGFPIGLLCCTVGVLLGNLFIFIMYKLYGNRIRDYFVKNIHLDFDKVSSSKKVTLIIFILYFLPAIPYGMICFFAASIGMRLPRYLIVTILGAIPSICIGVGLGHMAIEASWIISVIVFAVLIALLIVLFSKKEKIFAKINSYLDSNYTSKTVVRKCSPFIIDTAYLVSKVILFFKRIRIKYTNKIGKDVDSPSIVLCNHGSFLDFVYAGTLLRKKRPNFILARLYFYKKLIAMILRKSGCFPKSMLTMDIDSAKNCLRVLKNGDVLAMMPEARLSTAGRFEDIQEGTYSFLKNAGVPIYTIKMQGDYFASPKWGDGMRNGSYVEAELDILFTKEQLSELSAEEIKRGVEDRLRYDEFKWIKSHPELRYKSKTLAEGLENILVKCPKCKQKYSIVTNNRTVYCEKCGLSLKLDDRYSFEKNDYFENFADWYDWQMAEISREISGNADYTLESKVELKMPSLDGGTMLRDAGSGVCSLNRDGLTYRGTKDGEDFEIHFPTAKIYRLLFGAGIDFEVYQGKDIYYFVPEIKKSCVEWYMTSIIFYDGYSENGGDSI